MRKYLFIFLLATSCGAPRVHETDEEFKEYVQRFEQETGHEVIVPVIYDNKVSKEYAAVCEIFSDGYRIIKINPFHWGLLSPSGREEVVYHEIGHCVLKRGHTEELTTPRNYRYAIPNSIMYPYTFGDAFFYVVFRDHYVQELLHPGKKLEM